MVFNKKILLSAFLFSFAIFSSKSLIAMEEENKALIDLEKVYNSATEAAKKTGTAAQVEALRNAFSRAEKLIGPDLAVDASTADKSQRAINKIILNALKSGMAHDVALFEPLIKALNKKIAPHNSYSLAKAIEVNHPGRLLNDFLLNLDEPISRDNTGRMANTALVLARGDKDLTAILLKYGATDVSAKSGSESNILKKYPEFVSAINTHTKSNGITIDNLLAHINEPIDVPNGLTALMYAAALRKADLVQFLLESGADKNIIAIKPAYTAVQFAGDDKAVTDLLQ